MAGIDNFTQLLLHFSGSDGSTNFIDTIHPSRDIQVLGSAQIDTEFYKFPSSSFLNAAGGSYITASEFTADEFNIGTGSYTIDFWWRPKVVGSPNHHGLFTISGSTQCYINYISGIEFWQNSGSIAIGISSGFSPIVDTWYHLAFVKNGIVSNVYINGIKQAISSSINSVNDSQPGIQIGYWLANNFGTNANIDEFRYSSIARWTSSFTPPDEPYSRFYLPTSTINIETEINGALTENPVQFTSNINVETEISSFINSFNVITRDIYPSSNPDTGTGSPFHHDGSGISLTNLRNAPGTGINGGIHVYCTAVAPGIKVDSFEDLGRGLATFNLNSNTSSVSIELHLSASAIGNNPPIPNGYELYDAHPSVLNNFSASNYANSNYAGRITSASIPNDWQTFIPSSSLSGSYLRLGFKHTIDVVGWTTTAGGTTFITLHEPFIRIVQNTIPPIGLSSDINIKTSVDGDLTLPFSSDINILTVVTIPTFTFNIQLIANIPVETEVSAELTEIPTQLTADINIETEVSGDLTEFTIQLTADINIKTEVSGDLTEFPIQLTADINIETDVLGNLTQVSIQPLDVDINIETEVDSTLTHTGWISEGGTLTLSGSYRIHTFTTDGTFDLEFDENSFTYLLVAGGAPGGSNLAGGGGAGGVVFVETSSFDSGSFQVVVGQTHDGSIVIAPQNLTGSNSVLGEFSASGGGYGGPVNQAAGDGGSGGGGGPILTGGAGGTGSLGQGFNGGTGFWWSSPARAAAGGGGGAGGRGVDGTSVANGTGGPGGIARSIFISGSSQFYSQGGEGADGNDVGPAAAGPYPGSGGGGGAQSFGLGTSGKNGIVIIKINTVSSVETDINIETQTSASLSVISIKQIDSTINILTDITGIFSQLVKVPIDADINIVTDINSSLSNALPLSSTINIVTDTTGNLVTAVPLTADINVETLTEGIIKTPIDGSIINIETNIYSAVQRLICYTRYSTPGAGTYEDTSLESIVQAGATFQEVRNTGVVSIDDPSNLTDFKSGVSSKNINDWRWIRRTIAGFDTNVTASSDWRITSAEFSMVPQTLSSGAFPVADSQYHLVHVNTPRSGSFTIDDWTNFPSGSDDLSLENMASISQSQLTEDVRATGEIRTETLYHINQSGSTVLGVMFSADFHNENISPDSNGENSVDWYPVDTPTEADDPYLHFCIGEISTLNITGQVDITTAVSSQGVDTTGRKGQKADIFIVTDVTGHITELPVLLSTDINVVTITHADPVIAKAFDSDINIETDVSANLTEENVVLTADINIVTEISAELTEENIPLTAEINVVTEITGNLSEENIPLTADINVVTIISGDLAELNIPLSADINILTDVDIDHMYMNVPYDTTINIETLITAKAHVSGQADAIIDIITITEAEIQIVRPLVSTINVETIINGNLTEDNIPLNSNIFITTVISGSLEEDNIQLTADINILTITSAQTQVEGSLDSTISIVTEITGELSKETLNAQINVVTQTDGAFSITMNPITTINVVTETEGIITVLFTGVPFGCEIINIDIFNDIANIHVENDTLNYNIKCGT